MAKLTKEYSGKAIRIVTPCDVEAFHCGGVGKTVHCDTVLWDTGASVSVVSSRVASELNLSPTGVSFVSGFDGKKNKANTYRINVDFGDGMQANFIEVVESPMITFDMLIGMDIISMGDLEIKNCHSHTTKFTFSLD